MKIFISGGSGFVGSHICRELLSRGHLLRLLVHKRGRIHEEGVEQVEGDVSELATFEKGVAGCDAVINLVGIIREFPGKGVTFEKLHVKATENMVAAACRHGIDRYLQMSALGSRPNAVSRYQQSKYQAEEIVRGSGLAYTIFQPSVIFGPEDAFVNMLAGYIRRFSVVPVIGDGSHRLQPIWVDDVARCFALALELPDTIGRSYPLCGGDRFSFNEMVDQIGESLGKSFVIKVRNPLPLLKLVTPILEGCPLFPLTSDQITMMVEESICDGAWQESFRFTPTCFEKGIAEYLR